MSGISFCLLIIPPTDPRSRFISALWLSPSSHRYFATMADPTDFAFGLMRNFDPLGLVAL
jgi:hypothetical protein